MQNMVERRSGDYKARILQSDGQTVSVEVGYELGGQNFLSGDVNRRGVYCYLRHIEVSPEGYESFMVFEGFKVMLTPLSRRSNKAVKAQAERIDSKAPEIAEAFHAGNRDRAIFLIQAATGAGVTPLN